MRCIVCNKDMKEDDEIIITKKGYYGRRGSGFRATGMDLHYSCFIRIMWEKYGHNNIIVKEELYEHLSVSYKHNHLENENTYTWKLGTYKLTKLTQEELDKKELMLYAKMAKKSLLS